ncbi:prolow-density lipoprotein receptor-related protein 1-like isoform X1 [Littorina saxatilis]|uniref:prolow-density lipoprotein receptor-related protein 1-like isoform X1 n=1 Tax=Littorina saxatilis TaxID=31220 RepID=UPI0038B698AA
MFLHVCLLVFAVARCAEATACNSHFTEPTGSIQSLNYPNGYENRLRCNYTITVPVGHRIKLTFTHMDLESCCDYVQIRDGGNGTAPSLGQYPGYRSRTLPFTIRSSGNQMWIKFYTDSSVNGTGFYATYESAEAENYFFLITSSGYSYYSGPTIYRVDPDSIRYDRIPIGNDGGGYNQTSMFDALYNPIAIDYDPVEEKMYWTEETTYWTGSDTTVNRIRSAHLNGSNVETVLSANSRGVVDHNSTSNEAAEFDGIAVDPLSRLIFYSDVGNKEIVMLTMSSHARKTVVNADLDRPRAIVLDTANGVLYWTDWGTPAKIERANYDGSNRTTVVSTNLNYTNGLAIDVANNKLYWVDADTDRLESSDLEGNGRTVLYQAPSSWYSSYYNHHFFGLALFDNSLYVTDWGRSGSKTTYSRLQKKSLATNGTSISPVSSRSGRLNDIHAYHEKTLANVSNGCENNNGGCSVICIPLPNNRSKCACPDGQNLTYSGTDCIDDGFPKTTTSPPITPTPIAGCDHNYTALSGTIQPPDVPSWYSGGIACTYVITAPKGYRITLNVTFMSSYSSYACLEVRDGGDESAPMFNTFCTYYGLPYEQRSFGNKLWVRYTKRFSWDPWYYSANTRTSNGSIATYTSEKTDDYFLLVAASPRSYYSSSSSSSSHAIYRVDPDTAAYYRIPMNRTLYNPMAIDYDPVEEKIYWTEKGTIVNRIRSSSLNGRNIATILSANTVNAEAVLDGIAVDPLSRLMFYTDAGNKEIVMLTMSSPRKRKIVASSGVDKPRAVVLDPTNGVVYWTDWGTPAKIERANYDGSERTTVINSNLNYTNGLAIDVPHNKLYWVDAGTDLVESSNLDGNGRTVLYEGLSYRNFFGLALFQNSLYITDQGYRRYDSYSYYSRMNYLLELPLGRNDLNVSQILSMSQTLNDIHAYHEKTLASGPNGCGNNHGGCSVICIPLPNNRSKCACPDGQNLTSDAKHCGDEPSPRSTTTSSTTATTTPKPFVVQASISSSAPKPFVTNGLLELNLTCVLDHNIKVIGYEWNVPCFHLIGNTCVLRPQASDNEKNVTCMANMEYGWTSQTALYQIRLEYPPPSAPTITGYTAGEIKQAGERLTLTCTVSGGKPLVTSVNFLCNRHPDNKTDVRGQNKVQSVLDIRSLEPEDDAMSCVCTGDWMNRDFYKLSETITLRVNGTSSNIHGKTGFSTDSSTSTRSIVGAVVGVGVVIIIVIVGIVGIVFWKKRRSARDDTNGLVSNIQYTTSSESLS